MAPKKSIDTNFRLFFCFFIFVIFTIIFVFYSNFKSILYPKIVLNKQITLKTLSNVSHDGIAEYIRTHEQNLNISNYNKKIVFYVRIEAGYGNNLYAFLSSLVIAILSDSGLLVEWPEIDKYVNPPLKNLFFKFDPESEFSPYYKNKTLNFEQPGETQNTWKSVKDLEFLRDKSIPFNAKRIVYQANYPFFFDLCANPVYYAKLVYFGLVKKRTAIKAYSAFYDLNTNLTYQEKLESVLSVGFEVGSVLLNRIWKINSTIQADIDTIYKNNFLNHFVIGIQFRHEYLDESIDTQKFIDCALHIEKLFENKIYKWYVASERSWIIDSLKERFKEKIIEGKGQMGHTIGDSSLYYRAILDNELLARSNEIIITGGSTFGFIASIKNAKMPFYIEGKNRNQTNNTVCMRSSLSRLPRTPEGFAVI